MTRGTAPLSRHVKIVEGVCKRQTVSFYKNLSVRHAKFVSRRAAPSPGVGSRPQGSVRGLFTLHTSIAPN
jgi:hypothetical protein